MKHSLLSGLALLVLAFGLSGCDGGGDYGDGYYSEGYDAAVQPRPRPQPTPDMAEDSQARGATIAADGKAQAGQPRIEERRNYTLQFGAADPLVEFYHRVQEACAQSADCEVDQGRLQTPRHGQAYAYLAMRVARAEADTAEAVRLIEGSGALSGTEISREDRSRQMIDLQARLEQQIVLRERLQELAHEGREFSERSLQDLLQVERELARVQAEIESMQGQRRYLEQVTETISLSVSFQEQRWVEPHQHGVLAPLWRALDRSTGLFFESVGQVILVVVFLTPWLVLGIPLLWLLTRLWSPLRRGLGRLLGRGRPAAERPSNDGGA